MKQFHATGYVHCNIRWKNIIKYKDDWYLIDFTHAVSLHDKVGLKAISGIIKPEFIRSIGVNWDVSFDFYQVGKLIELSNMLNATVSSKFDNIKNLLINSPVDLNITSII